MKKIKMVYIALTDLAIYGLVFSGLLQLAHISLVAEIFHQLHAPDFLMTANGSASIFGAALLMAPRARKVKILGYAISALDLGIIIGMGLVAQNIYGAVPSIILLVVLALSWILYRKLKNDNKTPVEYTLFI